MYLLCNKCKYIVSLQWNSKFSVNFYFLFYLILFFSLLLLLFIFLNKFLCIIFILIIFIKNENIFTRTQLNSENNYIIFWNEFFALNATRKFLKIFFSRALLGHYSIFSIAMCSFFFPFPKNERKSPRHVPILRLSLKMNFLICGIFFMVTYIMRTLLKFTSKSQVFDFGVKRKIM